MPFMGEAGRPGGKLAGLELLFKTREHPPTTAAMPSAANCTRMAGDSLDSDIVSMVSMRSRLDAGCGRLAGYDCSER